MTATRVGEGKVSGIPEDQPHRPSRNAHYASLVTVPGGTHCPATVVG